MEMYSCQWCHVKYNSIEALQLHIYNKCGNVDGLISNNIAGEQKRRSSRIHSNTSRMEEWNKNLLITKSNVVVDLETSTVEDVFLAKIDTVEPSKVDNSEAVESSSVDSEAVESPNVDNGEAVETPNVDNGEAVETPNVPNVDKGEVVETPNLDNDEAVETPNDDKGDNGEVVESKVSNSEVVDLSTDKNSDAVVKSLKDEIADTVIQAKDNSSSFMIVEEVESVDSNITEEVLIANTTSTDAMFKCVSNNVISRI